MGQAGSRLAGREAWPWGPPRQEPLPVSDEAGDLLGGGAQPRVGVGPQLGVAQQFQQLERLLLQVVPGSRRLLSPPSLPPGGLGGVGPPRTNPRQGHPRRGWVPRSRRWPASLSSSRNWRNIRCRAWRPPSTPLMAQTKSAGGGSDSGDAVEDGDVPSHAAAEVRARQQSWAASNHRRAGMASLVTFGTVKHLGRWRHCPHNAPSRETKSTVRTQRHHSG